MDSWTGQGCGGGGGGGWGGVVFCKKLFEMKKALSPNLSSKKKREKDGDAARGDPGWVVTAM